MGEWTKENAPHQIAVDGPTLDYLDTPEMDYEKDIPYVRQDIADERVREARRSTMQAMVDALRATKENFIATNTALQIIVEAARAVETKGE